MSARSLPLRLALGAVLVAAASGCSSSREAAAPEPEVPATAVQPRVGLAATFEVPENPYAETPDEAEPVPFAASATPAPQLAPADTVEIDPNSIVVSRYDYGSSEAETEPYTDYEEAVEDYEDYYGEYPGYAADYYRYADPTLYPSVYTYYSPYRTQRTYRRHGWCRSGYYGSVYYNPYRVGYYDPYIGMYCYPYGRYRSGLYVSVGWGWGGYGHGYDPYYYDSYYSPYYSHGYGYGYGYGSGYGYRSGYRHGYSDGYYAGSYRPYRYDGRTRYRGGNYDDGERGRMRPGVLTRGGADLAGRSAPDPSRTGRRSTERRGLAPPLADRRPTRAPYSDPEVPLADGPTRRPAGVPTVSTPTTAPPRTATRSAEPRAPRISTPTRQSTPPRTATPMADPAAPRTSPPTRRAEPRRQPERRAAPRPESPRAEPRRQSPRAEPRRAEPRRESPSPAPRTERPDPRRESRPAPPPRRESRPSPPPRRESRPAPPPRRESRPSPPPRRESRPAPPPRRESRPSRSRSEGSSRRPSRRKDDG